MLVLRPPEHVSVDYYCALQIPKIVDVLKSFCLKSFL
jgi:hypothetical protein